MEDQKELFKKTPNSLFFYNLFSSPFSWHLYAKIGVCTAYEVSGPKDNFLSYFAVFSATCWNTLHFYCKSKKGHKSKQINKDLLKNYWSSYRVYVVWVAYCRLFLTILFILHLLERTHFQNANAKLQMHNFYIFKKSSVFVK